MLQPPLPCYFSFYCSLAATGKLGVLGFQGYLLPLHSRLGSRHLRCIYLFEASNHFRSDEVVVRVNWVRAITCQRIATSYGLDEPVCGTSVGLLSLVRGVIPGLEWMHLTVLPVMLGRWLLWT